MVALTCPECNSDKVSFCDSDYKDDLFACEECGKEFSKSESGWESK